MMLGLDDDPGLHRKSDDTKVTSYLRPAHAFPVKSYTHDLTRTLFILENIVFYRFTSDFSSFFGY